MFKFDRSAFKIDGPIIAFKRLSLFDISFFLNESFLIFILINKIKESNSQLEQYKNNALTICFWHIFLNIFSFNAKCSLKTFLGCWTWKHLLASLPLSVCLPWHFHFVYICELYKLFQYKMRTNANYMHFFSYFFYFSISIYITNVIEVIRHISMFIHTHTLNKHGIQRLINILKSLIWTFIVKST